MLRQVCADVKQQESALTFLTDGCWNTAQTQSSCMNGTCLHFMIHTQLSSTITRQLTWKAFSLALTWLFLASGKRWQTYDGRMSVWECMCVWWITPPFSHLCSLLHFTETLCYRGNTGQDFSIGLKTLLGTAVSESRRVCERQKKRMTQHLADDSKERKTTNKSRQTGNQRGCGRLSENWQWLDQRHLRFPHLSNLKSPRTFFSVSPVDCSQ